MLDRISSSEVFLRKGVLKICNKFTGEHPWRSAISRLYWNCTLSWVLACKFAAYFQNNFFQEHLWMVASGQSLFFNKAADLRPATLLKVRLWGIFLWLLRDFCEHLFLKNTSGGCFCTLNEYSINYSTEALSNSAPTPTHSHSPPRTPTHPHASPRTPTHPHPSPHTQYNVPPTQNNSHLLKIMPQ